MKRFALVGTVVVVVRAVFPFWDGGESVIFRT